MSPILFNVYMNDLSIKLTKLEMDVILMVSSSTISCMLTIHVYWLPHLLHYRGFYLYVRSLHTRILWYIMIVRLNVWLLNLGIWKNYISQLSYWTMSLLCLQKNRVYVQKDINSFNVIMRKLSYGLMNRLSSSDNILIKCITSSLFYIWYSSLTLKWNDNLFV